MKKLLTRSLLILATLTTATALTAAPPADPLRVDMNSTKERELKRQIDRFVTYPLLESERTMDGVVEVNFVIDSEGKVQVIQADASNDHLRSYVLRKLAKVDIGDNPNGTWKIERMRFVFHPEV